MFEKQRKTIKNVANFMHSIGTGAAIGSVVSIALMAVPIKNPVLKLLLGVCGCVTSMAVSEAVYANTTDYVDQMVDYVCDIDKLLPENTSGKTAAFTVIS